MSGETLSRGDHLLNADRRFSTGNGLISRLIGGGVARLLDRIDEGLLNGSIDAILPGGNQRRLGGRGEGPAAVVRLNSWQALVRLATGGSVGWFRAWMEGEWESPDPVALFELFMLNRHSLGEAGRAHGAGRIFNRLARAFQANTRAGARRNIGFHYDLGNDFYAAWLDETLTYSSAVFETPAGSDEPLATAQHRKVRLLLDRLNLKPGDHLLEIGSGWGYLAEVAAREYGARVTSITLSEEQLAFATRRAADAGLADHVQFRLVDYRDVTGSFDAVVSVEMVEAVGLRYWPDYLGMIARVLKPGGRAALQLISIDDAIFNGYARNADFIQTYVFPGGMLISESRFRQLAREAGLGWQDRCGYGLHYAETLARWRRCYDDAVAQGRLPGGFDTRFHQLWRYYLMYCEGGFRGGGIDVAQVTLVR